MSGIFGVISKGDCAEILFYGTDYHSHLEGEFGGIAILGEEFSRQIHGISQTQFKSKFYKDYKLMKGNKGIGVISSFEEQPVYSSSHGGFFVVINGWIDNSNALNQQLLKKGISLSEFSKKGVNHTELVAKLISQGENIVDGIEKMYDLIKGSCSLLLLNQDGVYAVRDKSGNTPLILGKREDALAVTTETTAFPNDDFKIVKFLEPGEITLINEGGVVQKTSGASLNLIFRHTYNKLKLNPLFVKFFQ